MNFLLEKSGMPSLMAYLISYLENFSKSKLYIYFLAMESCRPSYDGKSENVSTSFSKSIYDPALFVYIVYFIF
jgi:hypothetical protein